MDETRSFRFAVNSQALEMLAEHSPLHGEGRGFDPLTAHVNQALSSDHFAPESAIYSRAPTVDGKRVFHAPDPSHAQRRFAPWRM